MTTINKEFAAKWSKRAGQFTAAAAVGYAAYTVVSAAIATATAAATVTVAAEVAAATATAAVVETAAATGILATVGGVMSSTVVTVGGVAVPMVAAIAVGVAVIAALVWGGMKLWKKRKADQTAKANPSDSAVNSAVEDAAQATVNETGEAPTEAKKVRKAKTTSQKRGAFKMFPYGFAEVATLGGAVVAAAGSVLVAGVGIAAGTTTVLAGAGIVAAGLVGATALYFAYGSVVAVDVVATIMDVIKDSNEKAAEAAEEAATATAA